MKNKPFHLIFIIYVLTLIVVMVGTSCRSIKHLTKTVDKAFEKKDSTARKDSFSVKIDTSKFNTEVVIEYDSTGVMNKIIDGSESDWEPFVTDVSTGQIPAVHTTQKVKRIIIRTKTDLHIKDSIVTHGEGQVKTVIKTEIVKKTVDKKTTSYWWILLLLIPVGYLLYEKYKNKIYGIIH